MDYGFVGQNVKKGKPLYIEGYLKTRSWDNESGAKQYRTEIVIDNLVLIGPKPEGEVSTGTSDEAPF